MSTSYAAGLAFGIVTALIIFALVWKFSKKSMKGTFDERQELVRGRGYKYACFTFLGLLTLDLLIESLDAFETLPVSRTLAMDVPRCYVDRHSMQCDLGIFRSERWSDCGRQARIRSVRVTALLPGIRDHYDHARYKTAQNG